MRNPLKRRLIWLGAICISAILMANAYFLYLNSRANFERIRAGMTLAEVERFLGPPRHTRKPAINGLVCGTPREMEEWLLKQPTFCGWVDGPDLLIIKFDPMQGVVEKQLEPGSTWERIQWTYTKCRRELGMCAW
jgi:hypothetical protein